VADTGSGSSILIIDDEESILDGCRQALEKSGYSVTTSSDGLAGVNLTREIKPEVLFVDLKMPNCSGMDIIENISREMPDIVLIVITGYASIVSAVEAMKKGAYDYLPKPFTPDQLRAVTKRGIEHRRLKVEAEFLREEKARMEKNFITFVSHEMRSPLVTIQQYIESLKLISEGALQPEAMEIIQRCEKRIQNLHELIEHWLDISRIENGTFSEARMALDLTHVIKRSLDEMCPLCQRRGILLESDLKEGLPMIYGDHESLLRVFSNIIGNATKYTPPGGRIRVCTDCDDYYISVSVSDTGHGIPQDKLPFIFEPFYRVRGKQERQRGSGLGLTFSKKIMEAHNGRIEAVSKEGEGATFTMKFPRAYDT
jgi:signal transduction histidine kinase